MGWRAGGNVEGLLSSLLRMLAVIRVHLDWVRFHVSRAAVCVASIG